MAADQMRPASIRQWHEILDLIVCTHATCFAIYQCEFGADFPKPTRILASLPSFIRNPPKFASLPIFNSHGQYLGPLLKHCPHQNQHQQLIGKDETTGQWKTGPAAAYPPQMCQWLAKRVSFSFSDVPLQLLSKLWTTRDQFFLARKELSTQAAAPLKRKADKSPW